MEKLHSYLSHPVRSHIFSILNYFMFECRKQLLNRSLPVPICLAIHAYLVGYKCQKSIFGILQKRTLSGMTLELLNLISNLILGAITFKKPGTRLREVKVEIFQRLCLRSAKYSYPSLSLSKPEQLLNLIPASLFSRITYHG